MDKRYYTICLGAYFHDVGKIITNYLYNCGEFKRYIEGSKDVQSYKHARVGSLLLTDFKFPEPIIDIVDGHHKREVQDFVEVIQQADRFDASYRAGTAMDRGKRLPIEIAAASGLDVNKTLHGIELKDYVKNALGHLGEVIHEDFRLASLITDGFYREATIHLRSDSERDENTSLYAHAKIVAALVSLQAKYPNIRPSLVVIEPVIEERAIFMTVDLVEYLAGLHLYTYFGVLGTVSSTLDYLGLDPSFHIVSESSSRFVVILGERHMKTLMENLRELATDLSLPININSYAMEKGMLRQEIKSKLYPEYEEFPPDVRFICSVCHQPIHDRKLMLVLKKASKTIKLCKRCGLVTNSYKLLADSGRCFCVKKAVEGLLEYPRLKLAVVPCNPFESDEYVIARTIGFSRSNTDTVFPFINVHLNAFRKEYKYFIGISLTRLLNELISENKLHEYVSVVSILNRYIVHIVEKAKQSINIHPLEVVDDRAVLEVLSPANIKEVIGGLFDSRLKKYSIIALLRKGAPGTTYKKLRYVIDRLTSTDKIIAIDDIECALSLKDLFAFKELSQLLNVTNTVLYKQLIKVLETLDGYVEALEHGDDIERVYLKSVLMLRVSKPSVEMEELAIPEFPLSALMADEYGSAKGKEDAEKFSAFFDEKSKVKHILNVIMFVNKFGEMIIHE